MKWAVLSIFTLICCFFTGAYALDTVTDKSTGVSFPGELAFEHNGKMYQLEATGVATRKKLIFKVYSIVSYLQKDAKMNGSKFDAILSDDNAKQLTMKYVRDVSMNQIQDAFQDSFKRVFAGQEYSQMQREISAFLQFFKQGFRKGEECVLRWLPGGYVEVLLDNKKVGSLNNPAFAKGLWQIWFGQKSIVDRNDLVSLMR